uniref:Family with sequence similarity 183 member A n=1 Tax=Cyanistes caeruleus TaxID=156563 RepID=A0A8C0ZFY5_CYACU
MLDTYLSRRTKAVHMVARKPMSWHENVHLPINDEFLKLLHRAAEVPRKKYSEPQTESQEIGWHSTPLVSKMLKDSALYRIQRR